MAKINELILCRKFETNNPYKLENMLHNHYHLKHIKGEWFEMEDEQAIKFIEIYQQKQKIIEYLLEENEFYH